MGLKGDGFVCGTLRNCYIRFRSPVLVGTALWFGSMIMNDRVGGGGTTAGPRQKFRDLTTSKPPSQVLHLQMNVARVLRERYLSNM